MAPLQLFALEDADCGKSANFLPRKLVRAVAGSSPGHGAPEDAEQFLVLLCIRATVTRFSLQPSEAAPSSAAVSVPTLSQWTDIFSVRLQRASSAPLMISREISGHMRLNFNLLLAVFQLECGQIVNAGGKQQTPQDDNCARQPEGARWSYRTLAGLERVSLLFACFKVVLARLFLLAQNTNISQIIPAMCTQCVGSTPYFAGWCPTCGSRCPIGAPGPALCPLLPRCLAQPQKLQLVDASTIYQNGVMQF